MASLAMNRLIVEVEQARKLKVTQTLGTVSFFFEKEDKYIIITLSLTYLHTNMHEHNAYTILTLKT